jgi:hypothetical protein
MTEFEREAWIAFRSVFTKFLGVQKDPDYVTIAANMQEKFKFLGRLISLKINFLNSYLEFFPENLGAVSEEQAGRFHQDIKEMERIYQGRWNVNIMSDYGWMLLVHREIRETSHERRASPARQKDSTMPLNKI